MKTKTIFKLPALLILVGFLSVLQTTGFLIFGIKPDWALFAVIGASFFVSGVWDGLLIVAFSALCLKFGSGFEGEILLFSAIAGIAVVLKKYVPLYGILNSALFTAIGTVAFYFFTDKNLIISLTFFKELAMNIILGMAFFALLHFLWQNKGSIRE
ncbi:MAG: hypothetical protein NTW60_01425 [Candidatus Wolfebacteria bacterium]|nr:hypothetical protein [Candidatus Wolfebacteria bacterium]